MLRCLFCRQLRYGGICRPFTVGIARAISYLSTRSGSCIGTCSRRTSSSTLSFSSVAPEWGLGLPVTAKGRRDARLAEPARRRGLLAATVKNKKVRDGQFVALLVLDQRLHGDADAEELGRTCSVACWCASSRARLNMEQVVRSRSGGVARRGHPARAEIPRANLHGGFEHALHC